MSELLRWEIEWVERNSDRYSSEIHARSVIENIKKRYFISEAKRLAEKFNKNRTTGNRLDLLAHLS